MARLTKKDQITAMLESIRDAIAACDLPEREVFEALVSEADKWKSRLVD